jgi:predicted Zn-dependent peptidase
MIPLPDGVEGTTLPSGVRVITERMPDVRSVAVGFWLSCGSRDEAPQLSGASHFLEHLLFKGTRRRSALDIAAAIDAVGGDLNAFTSKEYTCFYARCLDRDLPLAVDILGDMITSARNRSADVDAERDVVLEEIRMHHDTPEDLVHSLFCETHYWEDPLGREVLGSQGTIEGMSREQVHRYYRRNYTPRSLVVAVAGNVEHDQVVGRVERAFADWEPPQRATRPRKEPRTAAGRVAVVPRPTEQAHVVLGTSGLHRGDDQRFVASVLNQLLGGGMASRLFQEVRERRGLAYSVYSYQAMYTDTGTFAVYAGTAPHKLRTVLDVVVGEFDRLLDGGLDGDEIARSKGHLRGSLVLALEDTGSRMTRLGKAIVTGTPLLSLDDTVAAVDAVTVEDVQALAGRFLTGPFTLAAAGSLPKGTERHLDRYAQPAA